ncbi:uncharacterized protein LOC128250243 [Octopus bimaculoides]|uniref:uncharacterized protein LOC128250243 n=1 Tax=Octopus bimaculoides TaxID=37653 RepID=UPI0022E93C46|nr:uncharacterized protein LOC128250243 [Octopus bimaculoides]
MSSGEENFHRSLTKKEKRCIGVVCHPDYHLGASATHKHDLCSDIMWNILPLNLRHSRSIDLPCHSKEFDNLTKEKVSLQSYKKVNPGNPTFWQEKDFHPVVGLEYNGDGTCVKNNLNQNNGEYFRKDLYDAKDVVGNDAKFPEVEYDRVDVRSNLPWNIEENLERKRVETVDSNSSLSRERNIHKNSLRRHRRSRKEELEAKDSITKRPLINSSSSHSSELLWDPFDNEIHTESNNNSYKSYEKNSDEKTKEKVTASGGHRVNVKLKSSFSLYQVRTESPVISTNFFWGKQCPPMQKRPARIRNSKAIQRQYSDITHMSSRSEDDKNSDANFYHRSISADDFTKKEVMKSLSNIPSNHNVRKKKKSRPSFKDLLYRRFNIGVDYNPWLERQESLPDQSPHNGYLSDENSQDTQDNKLLPLCGGDSEDDSFDILPSPRVSPDITHIPNVVVISDSETTQGCSYSISSNTNRHKHFLSVPKKVSSILRFTLLYLFYCLIFIYI